MDSRLKQWIDKVATTDRALAALLRGLVGAITDDDVTKFIWSKEFHRDQAVRREAEIRKHLGPYANNVIVHRTISEVAADDAMLEEALALGSKVSFLNN